MSKNILQNEDARIYPLAMALIVLLIIFVVATVFPPIKDTIIDILNAI